jgi:hypothetical protein
MTEVYSLHLEIPGTKAYTLDEARGNRLGGFTDVRI